LEEKRYVRGAIFFSVLLFSSLVSAKPTNGFQSKEGIVISLSADSYYFDLDAGPTTFTVNGQGETDLDCFLYDERGRLITADDSQLAFCAIQVTLKKPANYKIQIRNLGLKDHPYTLWVE
jgi:hypothetical protein